MYSQLTNTYKLTKEGKTMEVKDLQACIELRPSLGVHCPAYLHSCILTHVFEIIIHVHGIKMAGEYAELHEHYLHASSKIPVCC